MAESESEPIPDNISEYKYPNRESFEDAMKKKLNGLDLTCSYHLYYDKEHDNKVDDKYKMTLVWYNVVFYDQSITAFNELLKEEFKLEDEIRWIGVITTFQTPGQPGTGGREDATFLVSERDLPKISNSHRIHLGISWWFDVCMNGEKRLYPLSFRKKYSN